MYKYIHKYIEIGLPKFLELSINSVFPQNLSWRIPSIRRE